MKRRDFLKGTSMLGLATLFPSIFSACRTADDLFNEELNINFNGKIIIVGAGAAGLTAGYILQRYGIDFQILEASSRHGGRVKKHEGLADFPIDIGAEWIHTHHSIFTTMLSDENIVGDIDIIKYAPETLSIWKDDKLVQRNFYTTFYAERKFLNTTWFDFFEDYIVPSIQDKIVYNVPIESISYENDTVQMMDIDDGLYECDKVILTVPLSILKEDIIEFTPALPTSKKNALDGVEMPGGIKIFIRFSEDFYPDLTAFGKIGNFINDDNGERLYYDAAFGKNTNDHVLGLFCVGENASIYDSFSTEVELMTFVMNELDTIFEGKATETYLGHVVQNWSQEPYIRGSYSHFNDYSVQDVLAESIDNKIYFAGEAYAAAYGYDQATVHGAAQSAYAVIEQMLT